MESTKIWHPNSEYWFSQRGNSMNCGSNERTMCKNRAKYWFILESHWLINDSTIEWNWLKKKKLEVTFRKFQKSRGLTSPRKEAIRVPLLFHNFPSLCVVGPTWSWSRKLFYMFNKVRTESPSSARGSSQRLNPPLNHEEKTSQKSKLLF